MIEINLVPDIKQQLIKTQRIRSAVIASSVVVGIVSVAVVVLLAVFVFGVQTYRNKVADDQITAKSAVIAKHTDLAKTLTIQNQLSKISSLNNDKTIYSRVFDVLGAIIPPAPNDVQISTMTIDSNENKIVLDGQAQNNYAALEIFKKTIEGAIFNYYIEGDKTQQNIKLASAITTSDTSYGEDATGAKVLKFTLSFTYASEVFSPLSKNTSVSITVNGNVTDSYLGIPKSIFTDAATDIVEDK